MKRLLWLSMVVVLSGCSGPAGETSALPRNAQEASEAYDLAPGMLSNPLENLVSEAAEFGWNEDGTSLRITYNRKVIYDEYRGWGIYAAHGRTSSGDYVILTQEYEAGHYEPEHSVFINGERKTELVDEVNRNGQYIGDLKELTPEWLVVVGASGGSSPRPNLEKHWFIYQYRTGEVRSFGEL